MVYNSLQRSTEFKVDMHNLYIQALQDPVHKWVKLLFIATNDVIFAVMESWPLEWHAPNFETMEKAAAQQRKKDTKLRIAAG